MFTFIHGNFHVWQNESGQVMVSDESIKALNTYASMDAAVNALYLMNLSTLRKLAREMNKAYKAYKATV